jgi:hypothetical protein
MLRPLLVLSAIVVFTAAVASPAWAGEPKLFFSDLSDAPRIGLTDGVVANQGAIVTVWGKNLGPAQGDSKVFVGNREAAHVYTWCNADAGSGGGPSNLYRYHGMQEVSFAISSSTPTGPQKIRVQVGGSPSNELDIYVRPDDPSGNKIYFVKTTGSDGNSGTWASPWKSLDNVTRRGGPLNEGDIVYVCDGVIEPDGWTLFDLYGSENKSIGFIAYPGAAVIVEGWGNYNMNSRWINLSKLSNRTDGGNSYFSHNRIVGCKFTDIVCATGQSAAIVSTSYVEGDTYFGNFVHDFGGSCTSKLHHTTYFTKRNLGRAAEPLEFGWNVLKDNIARGGLHFYEEHACEGYAGVVKIHDNFVINQVGPALALQAQACDGGHSLSGTFHVYNNVFVGTKSSAILLAGDECTAEVKIYNNTIYGYGDGEGPYDDVDQAVFVANDNYAAFLGWPFAGSWEFRNNIIVDTMNEEEYFHSHYCCKGLAGASNNLWYNGGDGTPSSVPGWDSATQSGNPQFLGAAGMNFRILQGSPAVDNGSGGVASVVRADLDGNQRPMDGNGSGTGEYDIGAYEYAGDVIVDTTPPGEPQNLFVSICGNGVREGGEACDLSDDNACPGQCMQNCTCP